VDCACAKLAFIVVAKELAFAAPAMPGEGQNVQGSASILPPVAVAIELAVPPCSAFEVAVAFASPPLPLLTLPLAPLPPVAVAVALPLVAVAVAFACPPFALPLPPFATASAWPFVAVAFAVAAVPRQQLRDRLRDFAKGGFLAHRSP